jgi:hypothetical protein
MGKLLQLWIREWRRFFGVLRGRILRIEVKDLQGGQFGPLLVTRRIPRVQIMQLLVPTNYQFFQLEN